LRLLLRKLRKHCFVPGCYISAVDGYLSWLPKKYPTVYLARYLQVLLQHWQEIGSIDCDLFLRSVDCRNSAQSSVMDFYRLPYLATRSFLHPDQYARVLCRVIAVLSFDSMHLQPHRMSFVGSYCPPFAGAYC